MSSTRRIRRLIGVPIAVLAMGLVGVFAAAPAVADEPPPIDLNDQSLDISKFPGSVPPGAETIAPPPPPPPPPHPESFTSPGESPGCTHTVSDPWTDNELIRATINAQCPQLMEAIEFTIRIETLNLASGKVSTWEDGHENSPIFPNTRAVSYTLPADSYYKFTGCSDDYMRVRWQVRYRWAGTMWVQWDRTNWIPLPCGPDVAAGQPTPPAHPSGGLDGLNGPRAN